MSNDKYYTDDLNDPSFDYESEPNQSEAEFDAPYLAKKCSKCGEVEPYDLLMVRNLNKFYWYKCEECGHLEEGDE